MPECSYCAKNFKYESEKKRHELSHIPQFECKECSKRFSFKSALKRHQKQHERTCSVVCSNCGRSFKDDILLKRHIKYAHKGTHVCSKCSSTFSSEMALASHMISHKPKSERRFKCNYSGCNKSFNFTHHLRHHELTHTNQKQHSCKICGKGFIQLHHLKAHLKSHTSDGLLNCSVLGCNKTFTTECSRKRHIATHNSTVDSGISSDSNCDIPLDSTKGSKRCATCGQKIELSLYKIHKEKCHISNEEPKDLSLNPLSNKDHNKIKVKPELNCESILGGCIVSGDSPDNDCLCAQIKTDDDFHDIASPIEPFSSKTEMIPVEPIGDRDKLTLNTSCGGCDCSGKKQCHSSTNKHYASDNDLPQIEYRNDGVIKIKDTFDIDITEISTPKVAWKADEQNDLFNVFVPYNSCQAVLGRCIVSGNGTISDECLCAKMAMDDETNIAQEIDEITPQPYISNG
ncbi:zinc finger protein 564 [Bicyclus anynana]|uniref:Zinc finger protein 564 n=1 Tax=Bicyclus anynana TaxID=110368 RepID=A0A6J1PBP1_BICAN|nr:zinc finger protein 564 [Bicyclus anynana]